MLLYRIWECVEMCRPEKMQVVQVAPTSSKDTESLRLQ